MYRTRPMIEMAIVGLGSWCLCVIALDRLQRTSHPPRLIATPTGDHAAHHPAILTAIRTAVLPVTAVSASEHIAVSDITTIEISTGYTV